MIDQKQNINFEIFPYYKYHNRNFEKISNNEWLHTVDFEKNEKTNTITLKQLPLEKSFKQYKKKVLIDLFDKDIIQEVSNPVSKKSIEKVNIKFKKSEIIEFGDKSDIIKLLHL